MSSGDSKSIISNQEGIHKNLEEVVNKHLAHEFQKPMQQHTVEAFEHINELVTNSKRNVIFDSCCGVGESTVNLAKKYPDSIVIGVDKSAHRIAKNQCFEQKQNAVVVQADLNDFYRLAVQHDWPVSKQYILYPNPWPKSKHMQRRWHGSAVFPYIVKLCSNIEMRSNWRLYLEEFQFALSLCQVDSTIEPLVDENPLTPFERKYIASGQQCWQLKTR